MLIDILGDMCTLYGGTVQLLYWPVSTSTAANGTVANATATPTATEPATLVYEGYTLTSPSVYISFATVYALNDCNSTVGTWNSPTLNSKFADLFQDKHTPAQ